MKYKKFFQNEHGSISFYNTEDENLFAHRPFHWKDSVSINRETPGTRNCIDSRKMRMMENSDLWRIIPAELANQVICDYSEIIPEIRKMENRRKNLEILGIN